MTVPLKAAGIPARIEPTSVLPAATTEPLAVGATQTCLDDASARLDDDVAPAVVERTGKPRLIWAAAMPGQRIGGLWWPHSHNITAELRSLLPAADEHLGAPMIRMALNFSGWDQQPRRLYAGTRVIRLAWFRLLDLATVGIESTPLERTTLCVVPPEFPADAAQTIFEVLQSRQLWPTEPSVILQLGSVSVTAGRS